MGNFVFKYPPTPRSQYSRSGSTSLKEKLAEVNVLSEYAQALGDDVKKDWIWGESPRLNAHAVPTLAKFTSCINFT